MADKPRTTFLRVVIDMGVVIALVAWNSWGWRRGLSGYWPFAGRVLPVVLAWFWGQQTGFIRGRNDRLSDLSQDA